MKRLIKVVYLLAFAALVWHGAIAKALHDTDSLLTNEIQKQFDTGNIAPGLYFPNSVKRFYEQRKFAPGWIRQQNGEGHAWQGMLMIDCVLQFGLSHDDYHPNELLYSELHDILEEPLKATTFSKARFDIILTDAVITFMNHLHYGKLNPDFTAGQIDKGINGQFLADVYLNSILGQKNIMQLIVSVQPKCKYYTDLQAQMHLLKGLYVDDCYQVPEADVRKIAINMERIRWASMDDSTYIRINIPTYTLSFIKPDTAYSFKVVIGKPATPTPTLQSTIRYFTTAPEWRVPNRIFAKELLPKAIADSMYLKNNHFALYDDKGNDVEPDAQNLAMIKKKPSKYHASQSSGGDNALGLLVFRFNNAYDVYLHDTPEQALFKANKRAFSHGCIRVEQAEKLAALLLLNDNATDKVVALHKAIAAYKLVNFNLAKPVPIKITYITCLMKDGVLITYDDIYNLDTRLEMALYNDVRILSKN